jgi:hypothetical protein
MISNKKDRRLFEVNQKIDSVLIEMNISEEQAYRLHSLFREKEDIELEII